MASYLSKVLLHDKVIEVASRVDRAFLMQTTILHILTNLVNQILPHAKQLVPRQLVLSVVHIRCLV